MVGHAAHNKDDRDKDLHMYVPSHFAADEAAVDELLTRNGAADLITATPDGLRATMLPFLYDKERRALLGHFARNNDHWKQPVLGDALVIVRGPDSYISPSWYPSKSEHGRVVPTWNYMTAHVHGALSIHDDVDWLADLVRRLTDLHEAGRPTPWSVDDAPEKYFLGQLRAIVGVEIAITSIEAKFKLSQNRPDADIDGVIEGLQGVGDQASAAAVRDHRR
jgi:transcriptional regulator